MGQVSWYRGLSFFLLSNYYFMKNSCKMSGMDAELNIEGNCLPVSDASIACTSPCLSQLVSSGLQSLGEHGVVLPDVSEMLWKSSRMVFEVSLCNWLQQSNTPPPKLLFPTLYINLPSI